MNSNLRSAVMTDIESVLSWIPDAESMKLWAGPQVRYPATSDSVWQDIGGEDGNVFSMESSENTLLGFGQLIARGNSIVHIARVIVNPAYRGKGWGKILMKQLITTAVHDLKARQVTLNVYTSNHTALSLYQALGFRVENDAPFPGVVKMIRFGGI